MGEVDPTLYKAEEFTHFIPMKELEKFTMKDIGEIDDKFLFPIIDEEAYTEPSKPHLETELLSQPKGNIVADTKYVHLGDTPLTIPHDDKLVSLSAIQQPQEGIPPPDIDNEWDKTKLVTIPHLETYLFSQPKDNAVADTKYVYMKETLTTIPDDDKQVSSSAIQQLEDFPPPDLVNEWAKTEYVTFSMSNNITDIIDIHINKHIPLNEQLYSATVSNTTSTGENPVLLIDTPGCKIPKLDPWDPSVRDLIEFKDPFVCPGLPAFLESNPAGTITINRSILEMNYNITPEELICYYQPIYRMHEEEESVREVSYMFGNMVKLEFGVPIKEDFVNVSCNIKGSNYEQHLTLVPLKESVEEERNSLVPSNPILNVILIGIDSVSKLNFLRQFPKTHAFLSEKLRPFEMNGYTKVADNTFPNIVPLLGVTG
ncbi:hypothetical protein HNY73_016495 [Argiope bruennichi]|uniref:Uncharacterized protein n=1 Tax=Argiope bruennichi TaxID=94029 RepID=A0A8T0EKC2_ARGBR|nr:hypothetical protein HNY73_016495 [Argiope bruennichi]